MNTTGIWSDIDAKRALESEIEKDIRKSLTGNSDLNYSLEPAMRKIVDEEVKRIIKTKYSSQNIISKFLSDSENQILH